MRKFPTDEEIARVLVPRFNPNSPHQATRSTAVGALRKARAIRALWEAALHSETAEHGPTPSGANHA